MGENNQLAVRRITHWPFFIESGHYGGDFHQSAQYTLKMPLIFRSIFLTTARATIPPPHNPKYRICQPHWRNFGRAPCLSSPTFGTLAARIEKDIPQTTHTSQFLFRPQICGPNPRPHENFRFLYSS